MLKDIIAKRYGKALLALATQANSTEAVKKDLDAVAATFKASKGLQSVFMNPSFSNDDRAKVLKGLMAEMKLSDLSVKFLDLLLDKGRFRYVAEVAHSYSELLDLAQGKVKASVTTAEPLSAADLDRLKASVKALVGKDVELKVDVDPSLIGGVRTMIGSTLYDGSIKNQMQLMKAALLK
ncbi:MAG: ATP synthase F1 subunit delta [Nitrospirae bacterium]|nr:ATP synthase F1 subunit delta [Nitrospirota bacterium]